MLSWWVIRDINDLESMTGFGRVMPKVSVIVPSYNHARFLRRRMDSVLQQTYQDFELILLDDCSPDNSREILSSYAGDPRVRMEFNATNSGSTFKQWNKGVGLACGEYVWIAESDDYADPRFLEQLVMVLDSEPMAAYAYCRSWRVSAEDTVNGFGDSYLDDLQTPRWTADYLTDGYEECQKYFVHFNVVPNASAVVFRKASYEQVGGADESYRLGGDWKLWASLALTGKVAYLGEPLNYFRFHDQSVRGRDKLNDVGVVEMLRVVHWLLGKLSMPYSERTKIRKSLSCYWTTVILEKGLSVERRWQILQNAMVFDPTALGRLVRTLFQKFIGDHIRVFLWHPTLNATRPLRDALGLRRKQKSI
jgi:glycosyltransferase involved in cell wall biosynthesis